MNKHTLALLGAASGLILAASLLPARGYSKDLPPHALPALAQVPRADTCQSNGSPSANASNNTQASLSAALSQSYLRANEPGELLVRIDVQGLYNAAGRRPVALALVLDRSGSMAGEKAWQAREAAAAIIERLGPDDEVALVQYDDDAELLVPLTAMNELGKARLRGALGGVYPSGSTNLGGGLSVGREALLQTLTRGRLNRMIVLSDGLANRGVTDRAGLVGLAEASASRGVSVTTIGVGIEYDEDALADIADAGRGRYYYVQDAVGLRSVLEGELDSLTRTVATGLTLRLEPTCAGVSVAEVYGYPAQYQGGGAVIPLSDLSENESRKIIARLTVPASAPGPLSLLQAELLHQDPAQARATSLAVVLGTIATIEEDLLRPNQNRNGTVLGGFIEAENSKAIEQAAAEYGAGNHDQANAIIQQQEAKAREFWKDNELNAAELAPVMQSFGNASTPVTVAPRNEADSKAATKSTKYKARDLARH
jgi:Ca-activated chloride channel family protein